jgi:hypothetical protein
MSDMVTPCSALQGSRQLRSVSNLSFAVKRTRLKFGDRAFSVAGPDASNDLHVKFHFFAQHSVVLNTIKDTTVQNQFVRRRWASGIRGAENTRKLKLIGGYQEKKMSSLAVEAHLMVVSSTDALLYVGLRH